MHQSTHPKAGAAGVHFLSLCLLVVSSACASEVQRVGTIAHPEIKECSGIVASRQFPDVFWTHTDGKKERLYAINRKGETLGEFKISGAKFHDWEDIAIDAENNIYVADTGNNDGKRTEVAVYQFPEPKPDAGEKAVTIKRQWVLRYPSGSRDCESILILGGNGYLISKVKNNRPAEIYSFPLQETAESITLKPLGALALDAPVTSAAVSTDGKRLAALSELGAYLFTLNGAFPGTGLLKPERHIRYRHNSIEGCTFVPEGLLVTAESREILLFKLSAQ